SLGCEISYEKVIGIDNHKVITRMGDYEARSIIIASGLTVRKLGLENEDNLVGKGISYCATCDGNFYRNKNVLVVGGGNTALEDALFLSNVAKKVYIMIRRDEFRGDKIFVDKVVNSSNIEIIKNANVKKLIGNDCLKGVTYQQGNEIFNLDIDGLFVAIGRIPDSDYLEGVVSLDDDGYVISDNCETNKDYIFVAGDIRTKNLRQVITAASDGAIAATKASQYLLKNK
ncbi:MAG: FAD-dependent oxidoreductase, partial [Bacilli bacterium]|nr:FAD-dependent oxidoreductase [Bacilli bacterium]